MNTPRPIALLAALLIGAAASFGQTTAKNVFANAPQSIFPLLDHDTRLDMIDYFESGMSTASKNAMAGKSRITAMTPTKVSMQMSDASDYEVCLLPTAAGDTLVALIATVATPAPDSRMSVYSKDWAVNLTSKTFAKPVLADWLTDPASASEVEGLVPFLLISYSYNPDTRELTLTNNTGKFLSADVYEIVAPSLKSSITYKWNGSKFTR